MIFLYIAIAWIVLLVLFVIVWARFAGRRRRLSATIERDRQRSREVRVPGHDDTQHSEKPGDAA